MLPPTPSTASRPSSAPPVPHVAVGGVRSLLRLEGLCVLLASLLAYHSFTSSGWGLFALCFLVPDLSLFGYAAGPRLGAVFYNCAHTYAGALPCLAAGVFFDVPGLVAAGLIWTAHIGFDRALGYGLKYGQGFRLTHLGLIGHDKHNDPATRA